MSAPRLPRPQLDTEPASDDFCRWEMRSPVVFHDGRRAVDFLHQNIRRLSQRFTLAGKAWWGRFYYRTAVIDFEYGFVDGDDRLTIVKLRANPHPLEFDFYIECLAIGYLDEEGDFHAQFPSAIFGFPDIASTLTNSLSLIRYLGGFREIPAYGTTGCRSWIPAPSSLPARWNEYRIIQLCLTGFPPYVSNPVEFEMKKLSAVLKTLAAGGPGLGALVACATGFDHLIAARPRRLFVLGRGGTTRITGYLDALVMLESLLAMADLARGGRHAMGSVHRTARSIMIDYVTVAGLRQTALPARRYDDLGSHVDAVSGRRPIIYDATAAPLPSGTVPALVASPLARIGAWTAMSVTSNTGSGTSYEHVFGGDVGLRYRRRRVAQGPLSVDDGRRVEPRAGEATAFGCDVGIDGAYRARLIAGIMVKRLAAARPITAAMSLGGVESACLGSNTNGRTPPHQHVALAGTTAVPGGPASMQRFAIRALHVEALDRWLTCADREGGQHHRMTLAGLPEVRPDRTAALYLRDPHAVPTGKTLM